ncbi:MAG: Flp family type IVb pilin [Bdellovibrionaceae bacterium]|nr:Flp family type IVb pilin [Pseudobdellovibrionaceae bacterium]
MKRNFNNQKGQGLIEYLVLVALIAVGTMATIRILGQSVNVKFAKVAESLGADVQSDIGNAQVTTGAWKKKDMRDFMQGSGNRRNNSGRNDD